MGPSAEDAIPIAADFPGPTDCDHSRALLAGHFKRQMRPGLIPQWNVAHGSLGGGRDPHCGGFSGTYRLRSLKSVACGAFQAPDEAWSDPAMVRRAWVPRLG